MMTALEYLQIKYRTANPPAMTAAEARAFGIGWPLKKGWQKLCAVIEVTDAMRSTISSKLGKKAKGNHRKPHKSVSPYHKAGVETMRLSGPVTIIVSPTIGPRTQASPILEKRVMPRGNPQYRGPRIDPNSPEFLTSYQWRSLRMDALVKYGAACMCCGITPAHGAVMNVDHIKPRRLYPELALDINNLQILCGDCNHGKGNRDQTDWRGIRETELEHMSEFSEQRVHDLLKTF